MLFNSIDFLLFFPLVTAVCFFLPFRVRWVWLLAASYYFYMCWNVKYALLIALSTLITYASGLLIHWRRKRLWVLLSFASNLAILFFFKYFGFFLDNLSAALALAGVAFKRPAFDVILPVGISFYTFQALSYTMDVYRGEVEPERNPFRYALFVSFFPQLVAGPIERSKNLLGQLYERHDFDPDRARDGMLLMLWGMFEKIVVADRLALLLVGRYEQYSTDGVLLLRESRQRLANESGLCVKSVNRGIQKFLDEGLISKEGTRIIVDRAQHQALRDFLSQKVHLDPSGMSFK